MFKKLFALIAFVVLSVSTTLAMDPVRVYGTEMGLNGSQAVTVEIAGNQVSAQTIVFENGAFTMRLAGGAFAAYTYVPTDVLTVLDAGGNILLSRRMDMVVADQAMYGDLIEPTEIDLTQAFTFTNDVTVDNGIFRVLDANGDPLFEIDPSVVDPIVEITKLHVTDELISDVIIQQAGNNVADVTTAFATGDVMGTFADGLTVQTDAIESSMIKDGEIVNADIADNTITEAKLAIANAPVNDYVITWDNTAGTMKWVENPNTLWVDAPLSGAGTSGDPLKLDVDAANFEILLTGELAIKADGIADAEVVNALTIDGGTVNNTVIGGTNPAAGTFTNVVATNVTSDVFATTDGSLTISQHSSGLPYIHIENGGDVWSLGADGTAYGMQFYGTAGDVRIGAGDDATTNTGIQVLNASATPVFAATADGNVTLGTVTAGTWNGTVIDETYLDANVVLDTETPTGGDLESTYAALTIKAGAVDAAELASTGVTAAAYGSAIAVPTFTVDEDGRLTAAADVNINIPLETQTTGNYVATVADAGGLTVTGSGVETAPVTVALDMAHTNTWTADQNFGNLTATGNILAANHNILLTQSAGTVGPELIFYKDSDHTTALAGFGPNGTGYGLRVNDNLGNQRGGIGYYGALSAYVAGVSNDGGDMAGVMTDGTDNNMNLRIVKDGATTFNADIDGIITAATWNGTVIADAYIDAAITRDAELALWAGTTNVTTLGTITTGTWNGTVIADAYIDAAITRDAELAAWVGTTNVTTLGTITTGTWNGTVIADAYIDAAISRDTEALPAAGDISGTLAAGYTIDNDAVTTAKILDANVTVAKIAPGVTTQIMRTNGANAEWANVADAMEDLTIPAVLASGTATTFDGSTARTLGLNLNAAGGLEVAADALGIKVEPLKGLEVGAAGLAVKTAVNTGVAFDGAGNLAVDRTIDYSWTGAHSITASLAGNLLSVANTSTAAAATALYVNYANDGVAGGEGDGVGFLLEAEASAAGYAFGVYNDGAGDIARFGGAGTVTIANNGNVTSTGTVTGANITTTGKVTTGGLVVGVSGANASVNVDTQAYVAVADDAAGTAPTVTIAGTPVAGQVLYVACADVDGFTIGATIYGAAAGNYILVYNGAAWLEF